MHHNTTLMIGNTHKQYLLYQNSEIKIPPLKSTKPDTRLVACARVPLNSLLSLLPNYLRVLTPSRLKPAACNHGKRPLNAYWMRYCALRKKRRTHIMFGISCERVTREQRFTDPCGGKGNPSNALRIGKFERNRCLLWITFRCRSMWGIM